MSISLNQVLGAFILLGVIKVFRILTDASIVLGSYTIFVIYSPIMALAGLPADYSRAVVFTIVKSQQLDLFSSLSYYLRGMAKPAADSIINGQFFVVTTYWLGLFSAALSLVETVLVAECLYQTTSTTRFNAYVAVTVASLFFVLPGFVEFVTTGVLVWAEAK
jgi:hypothetical protein